MTNYITSAAAMMAALNYSELNYEETNDRYIVRDGGMYYVSFRTLFMAYELYVDALSGEVLGFNAEPALPADTCTQVLRAA